MRAVAGTVATAIVGIGPKPALADGAPARPVVVEETPVTALSPNRSMAHNSPSLAADPTDARFVTLASRIDGPDFSCTLHLSGDGGRGWVPARPVPRLPRGAEKCYAPEVAFDREGILHYLFVGLRGRANHPMGVFLTTSSDQGRHFTPPRRLLGPHVYMVRMALDRDRGHIHLAWVQGRADPTTGGFPPVDNPVLAAHSEDGGLTWSRPERVSDPGPRRVVAPAVAVGTDGAVHVLYYDLEEDARDYQGLEGPVWEGTWSLRMATARDGPGRFERPVVVEPGLVPTERIMVIFTTPAPALVADGRTLYVAWSDARNGDWDVLLRRSTDAGRTWGAARPLGDGNGRHQYLPRLGVAPRGRLDAVFYDRRHDPENVRNHVSYSFSTDGGRTFSPNRTVTSEPSDSRIGVTFPALVSSRGLVEIGSRLGLLSGEDEVVTAWTDTRNATAGEIQQDIFAATLERPGGEGGPSLRLPLVAAVAVTVGMAIAVVWVRRVRRGVRVENI